MHARTLHQQIVSTSRSCLRNTIRSWHSVLQETQDGVAMTRGSGVHIWNTLFLTYPAVVWGSAGYRQAALSNGAVQIALAPSHIPIPLVLTHSQQLLESHMQ